MILICGEIHTSEHGRVVKAVDLRPTTERCASSILAVHIHFIRIRYCPNKIDITRHTIHVVPMYTLYFDGSSKGNPGVSRSGSVLYEDDTERYTDAFFVGNRETNNVAEYTGLIRGLEMALQHNITTLVVRGDSKLVISQMNGVYKVKSMKQLYERADELRNKFTSITFQHIDRKQNRRADELANQVYK